MLLPILLALACQRQQQSDEQRPAAAASGEQLDGMQLESARRVALESATAAMKRRDLKRLKQLSVWVRNRAHVVIFDADDLKALDLAIQCLEHVSTDQAAASLEQIESGKLRQHARAVCQPAAGRQE